MKRNVLIVCLSLISFIGRSSTWLDPNFSEAVHDAKLICNGVVEHSTPEKTTIRITKLFKGNSTAGQSVVIWSAAHAHGHDSLPAGTEFFFMVKKHKNAFKAFTNSFWVFKLTENMISVPVRDPIQYINIERKPFFTFLDLLIKNSSPEDARGFVDGELSKLKKLSPLTKKLNEVENQMFILEVVHHFGIEKYSTDVIKFMDSPYYHVRWSCTRALATCGGEASKNAILKQLKLEDEEAVQSVLGKAVFMLNINEAKPILIKKIPKVSDERVHLSSSIMTPVFNTLPAPRNSYGAALMHLNGQKGSYEKLLSKAADYIQDNPDIKFDILENKKTYYSMEKAMEHPEEVYILVLHYEQLTTIPQEVAQMKNLKSLTLSRNKIKELPAFLFDLELIELDLSQNELMEIPNGINRLTELRKLDLSFNSLTHIDLKLLELTQLEELNLAGNQIKEIPEEIRELDQLIALNLRLNSLNKLPNSIVELDNLEEMELDGNEFVFFPEEIFLSKSLIDVDLASNKIKHLPNTVVEMELLKYLDLSYNPLSLKEREEIANLSTGLIVNTTVYNTRVYSIFEALENPKKAKIIHDNNNDYQSFIHDLSELSFTTSLVFYHNNLNSFPKGLTSLSQLETLRIDHNNITEIPEDIGRMIHLKNLYLNDNKLNSLPDSFQKLKLKYLNLKGNNFSDTEKERVSSWFDDKVTIVW